MLYSVGGWRGPSRRGRGAIDVALHLDPGRRPISDIRLVAAAAILSACQCGSYASPMTQSEMIQAYSAPGRHYHNLKHIEDCLAELDGVEGLDARDRKILTAAIWWHDIVYDPTRSDNEEESAKLAERDLTSDLRDEAGRLIRLTKTHDVQPEDRLGAIMISIDLAILGAEAATYAAYSAAIRREYAHVPDDAYRAGRRAVLERFLARSAIYPDPAFSARLEGQARKNIAREIDALRAGPAS